MDAKKQDQFMIKLSYQLMSMGLVSSARPIESLIRAVTRPDSDNASTVIVSLEGGEIKRMTVHSGDARSTVDFHLMETAYSAYVVPDEVAPLEWSYSIDTNQIGLNDE